MHRTQWEAVRVRRINIVYGQKRQYLAHTKESPVKGQQTQKRVMGDWHDSLHWGGHQDNEKRCQWRDEDQQH